MPRQMLMSFADEVQRKRCCRCLRVRPITEFHRNPENTTDGRSGHCRDCQAVSSKASYARHRTAVIEREKKKRLANPGKYKDVARRSYQKNINQNRAYREKRKRECPERDRAQKAAYVARNKERVLQSKKDWVKRNPDKQRAIKLAMQTRRRARKNSAVIGDLQEIDAFYSYVRESDEIRCRWCNCEIPKGKRHVDHVIPISRGGSHTLDNLCCACVFCNSSKHNKMPEDFIAILKQRGVIQ